MWMVYAVIAGAIAGVITGIFLRAGGGQSAAMDVIGGLIGGWLGGWIMHTLGTAPGAGAVSSTWVALLGGFVLTVLLRTRGGVAHHQPAGNYDH
ncbi:MAG: hypothetical protein ACRD04_02330 [Terriglobales bacterium]